MNARTVLTKAREPVRCEARACKGCTNKPDHVHHVRRRAQGGMDTPDNLLWICGPCHRWVHEHPAEAQAYGLLVKGWQDAL